MQGNWAPDWLNLRGKRTETIVRSGDLQGGGRGCSAKCWNTSPLTPASLDIVQLTDCRDPMFTPWSCWRGQWHYIEYFNKAPVVYSTDLGQLRWQTFWSEIWIVSIHWPVPAHTFPPYTAPHLLQFIIQHSQPFCKQNDTIQEAREREREWKPSLETQLPIKGKYCGDPGASLLITKARCNSVTRPRLAARVTRDTWRSISIMWHGTRHNFLVQTRALVCVLLCWCSAPRQSAPAATVSPTPNICTTFPFWHAPSALEL